MIVKLPRWVLVEKFPAFNDLESLTVNEQTARIYGKMNELIESYNKYVDEVNKTLEEFEVEKDKPIQDFICRISCLTDNYINTVDMKIAHQNRQIAEVYSKFNEDVINTLKLIISDLKSTGELDNAIYESLDNINVKVDNFISECEQFKKECEQFKTDMNSDYEEITTNLESDYQTTKTNLANDYTTTKDQLEFAVDTRVAQFEDAHDVRIKANEDYIVNFDSEKRAKIEQKNLKTDSWGATLCFRGNSIGESTNNDKYYFTTDNNGIAHIGFQNGTSPAVNWYAFNKPHDITLYQDDAGIPKTIPQESGEPPISIVIPNLEQYSLVRVSDKGNYCGLCMVHRLMVTGSDNITRQRFSITGMVTNKFMAPMNNYKIIFLEGSVSENNVYTIENNESLHYQNGEQASSEAPIYEIVGLI